MVNHDIVPVLGRIQVSTEEYLLGTWNQRNTGTEHKERNIE
jgi:hypothetical protein